jgi:hypothetical protein
MMLCKFSIVCIDIIFQFFISAIYEKIMEHLRQFYDFKINNVMKRKVRTIRFLLLLIDLFFSCV